MYFVDRSKIEKTLEYVDTILHIYPQQAVHTFVEKLSLERAVHLLIESILDVGNMMIDGFIMRDPGSYNDIIDILIDEKVLPEADEQVYKQLIQLRSSIVKDYLNIDHSDLESYLAANRKQLKTFSSHVRVYLDNEFGVANAFSNER
ncbi:DUF86 domain-containing protein [Virgibacillus sp. W0181]|uniref:DUF86 domain-containing protein n=1 Tax=Virgibacillus sp. W0181 TaxID=3391581 RepID=UPI003F44F1F6